MKKYDLAIEATKLIAEHCTTIKLEFSEAITTLLSSSEKSFIPTLPQKRSPPSSSNPEKRSKSTSSEEPLQSTLPTIKSFLKTYPQICEEELRRVYSSEISSESEKLSEISSLHELEELISALKTTQNLKSDLEKIIRFLEKYPKMGLKERKDLKNTLEKFFAVKISCEDMQVKAVFSEVQGKVKNILSDGFIDEDWDRLFERIDMAVKEGNKEKIAEIVKRIHAAFPANINEKMTVELDGLVEVLRKVLEISENSEVKVRISKILEKWGNRGKQNVKEIGQVINKFDFKDEKKSINTIEAAKTVPAKTKRR